MRTGTRVSIWIAVFTCSMVLFLVVGVVLLGIWIPAARGFWQYVPQTITALLGVNGLSFGIVEIRKAIEFRALKKGGGGDCPKNQS